MSVWVTAYDGTRGYWNHRWHLAVETTGPHIAKTTACGKRVRSGPASRDLDVEVDRRLVCHECDLIRTAEIEASILAVKISNAMGVEYGERGLPA